MLPKPALLVPIHADLLNGPSKEAPGLDGDAGTVVQTMIITDRGADPWRLEPAARAGIGPPSVNPIGIDRQLGGSFRLQRHGWSQVVPSNNRRIARIRSGVEQIVQSSSVTDMNRIYLDNAATSHPKPPRVIEAMQAFARTLGASPGRGSYRESIEASNILSRTRASLCRLVNGADPNCFIFTLNTTDALNLAIKGTYRHWSGKAEPIHVVTSAMDHNSVLRPLDSLREDGIELTHLEADPDTGLVDPSRVADAIRPHTRLVAMVHGSNVTGTIQPIGRIGRLTKAAGIPLLVDAAQTMGHIPIDVQDMHVDMLAFPGHKGLLGPLGTGGLYVRPGAEQALATTREGGTGSLSEQLSQPDQMPDRFESGSHNTIGIAGLEAALDWLHEEGVQRLRWHEETLMSKLIDGLDSIEGVRLLGPRNLEDRCGVFSLVHEFMDPATMATRLEREHGILSRAGLHCAPMVHETFGTIDSEGGGGALRLSIGPFNTSTHIDHVLEAVRSISHSGMETAVG